jgi:O-antigen/teichoic acid export membrane protein
MAKTMIARKTILIVLQNALGMLFGYIALKFIALELGPDEIGMVTFGFSVIALFSFISHLGYNNAHMKRISEGKDLGKCIGTFIAIKVGLTALMTAAVIIALTVFKQLYPAGLKDTNEAILYAMLGYFIFQSLASIPIATFDARAETSKSQIPYMVQHPFKLIGVLFVVFAAGPAAAGEFNTDPDVAFNLAMTYYFFVGIIVMVGAWALLLLYKYPISRPDKEIAKSYTKFALPVFLASIMAVLIMNTDRVMIGFFWNSTMVGEYFGVQKITEMILVVSVALGLLLFPIISKLSVNKDYEAMRKLIFSSERYTSMLVAPIMFFLFFFSRPVIHLLLSDDWLSADFTLSFLGIYAFIVSLNKPRVMLLLGLDRPDLTARVSIIMCVLNVTLNALFVPDWDWLRLELVIPGMITPSGLTHHIALNGHTGAAIATTLATLTGFLCYRYLTWRHVKASLYHGFTIKHIFASIIMVTVLILMARNIGMDRWYHLILFAVVGLAIYMAILYLMKELKKEDIRFYLSLMDPRAMKDYMKTELKEKDLKKAHDDLAREEE